MVMNDYCVRRKRDEFSFAKVPSRAHFRPAVTTKALFTLSLSN